MCAAGTPALMAFLVDNCQSHDSEILCRLQLHSWQLLRASLTPRPSWKPRSLSHPPVFHLSLNLNLLKQKEPVKRGKVIIYTFLLPILIHMYLRDSAFALEPQGMEEGT